MKKLIILIVIALTTTIELFAQAIPFVSNPNFPFEKFDKNRIDIGTLYVYEYSENKEDFEPSYKEYLYIKTLKDIEIMSIDTKNLPDITNYTLNWNYMMLEKEYYKSFENKNDIKIHQAYKINVSIDFTKKTLKNNTYGREKDGFQNFNSMWKFEKIPTYFYQYTALMPLWFTLRFYPLEKEKITVNSLTNNYNVDFDIKYEGKEEVEVPFGKVLSYKFELIPKLSFFMKIFSSPKKAFIWLSAENNYRYMVKYRNNNERSTFTQSMEYRLAERKKMTLEEWEQFKEKHGAKDTN